MTEDPNRLEFKAWARKRFGEANVLLWLESQIHDDSPCGDVQAAWQGWEACAAAERERCAKICEINGGKTGAELAEYIRL